MIVKCAKCQAGYEFPVEQLPPDGLRAKCASCKHVMWIRQDGTDGAPVDTGSWRRPGRALGEAGGETPVSTLPPPVVAPPQHERTPTPAQGLPAPQVSAAHASAPQAAAQAAPQRASRPQPLQRRASATANRGIRLAELAGERPRKLASRDKTHQTAPKAEKDTEQGPSVIIDMGQLSGAPPGPSDAAPEPPAPPPPPLAAPPDPAAAAFAPLSTPAPSRPRPSVDPPRNPNEFGVDGPGEIKAVKPPRLWIFGLVLLALAAAGFVLFVWWRNDWGPILADPQAAFEIGVGLRERPVEEPEAPPIVETAPSAGSLVVQKVELALVKLPQGERAALIKGIVSNQTNRFQKAIGIEASLVEVRPKAGPLKLKTRLAACCTVVTEEETKTIALDPEHAHFSELIDADSQARLAPGESRPFAVIVTGLGKLRRGQQIQGAATIKFSEPE